MTLPLPVIATETETLEGCFKLSIARFGDGELRLAIGGACSSQRADDHLARELRNILATYRGFLVGIPNFDKTPRRDVWDKYAERPFWNHYRQTAYVSSFITRPDNAPWIDTPEYWARVRQLWEGEDVTLVVGDEKSLTRSMLMTAKSVRSVVGPRQHAYADIGRIEEEIGLPSGPVLLCLGATATALAARLDAKGIRALDLGHIGMFMRHAGIYQLASRLASKPYREQLRMKHSMTKWGGDGHSHLPAVLEFARAAKCASILDYGCGRGTLKIAMNKLEPAADRVPVREYDPGILGKDAMPKPADLIVSTDVLEHVEPEHVDTVLQHIFGLAERAAYLVIALTPARELLPDGRNAHLSVHPADWWMQKLSTFGGWKLRVEKRKGLHVWATK